MYKKNGIFINKIVVSQQMIFLNLFGTPIRSNQTGHFLMTFTLKLRFTMSNTKTVEICLYDFDIWPNFRCLLFNKFEWIAHRHSNRFAISLAGICMQTISKTMNLLQMKTYYQNLFRIFYPNLLTTAKTDNFDEHLIEKTERWTTKNSLCNTFSFFFGTVCVYFFVRPLKCHGGINQVWCYMSYGWAKERTARQWYDMRQLNFAVVHFTNSPHQWNFIILNC